MNNLKKYINQTQFLMIYWDFESVSEKVLIGKGGYASVYRVTFESEDGKIQTYALKKIDVKLDSFATVIKQANFFKKFFREL